jgi:chemotaxis response regulator CheB
MTNARKILIVDDDAELRDALVEQLALHEEFDSVAVDNGTKGVQAAKAGQIDLVIMDVGLPDVDGVEARHEGGLLPCLGTCILACGPGLTSRQSVACAKIHDLPSG